MPIEKRPTNPIPKGPRPGSRMPPHKVGDNETLESVARKYGVPVIQLIAHNFSTMDPAEINWYLRFNVGCKLITHDRKNWRFSAAADPGLIYIPERHVLRMDPLVIVGQTTRIDLNFPGAPEFPLPAKFVYELPPIGPVDLGVFRARAKFSIEGQIKQEGGKWTISLKKDQVKAAIEKKFTEDTSGTLAVKFDEKSLTPIAEAVAKGSKESFAQALLRPFEATIKTKYHWSRNLSVVPEAGVEFAEFVSTKLPLPVIFRVSGEYEDFLFLEGGRFKGKFVVKAGFNVGLSAKGWEWVAQKVGRPVLRQFLMQGGRALATVAEWLTVEGVLTVGAVAVGTVAGTLALTSLMAWVVQDARRKGELIGLATWYVSAYSARVFREPRPTGFIVGDSKLRDQLVLLGEKDALLDARAILARANSPAARGPEAEALEAFREMLLVENNGSYDKAKLKLRLTLEEKSRRLAGL